MKISRRVLVAVAATVIVAATATTRGGSGSSGGATTTAVDRTYTANYENVLGTSLELRVRAPDQIVADRATQVVLAEIARQAQILSSWDPKSEVSQWARTQGQPVRVSRELFDVLDLFDQWRSRSHGVIDPAAQAVIALWTTAAAEHRLPTDQERTSAVTAVRQQHWTLDRAARTATHLSTTPLVLASFTKSYIMNRAVEATRTLEGVHGLVLNVGGDILARGAVAEPIDIANPRDDAENSAPWRPAATIAAASTSTAFTTPTSSIRAPPCRRRT
jgi:thiamine biosynthesis lipoprotein ApbE